MREHLSPLPINPDVERIIRIDNCGYCTGMEDLISDPRTLVNEYIIHYFVSGKGWYSDAELGKMEFEDDHIVVSYPGRPHCVDRRSDSSLEHYYVAFSGTLPELLISSMEKDGMVIFPIERNRVYAQRFETIMEQIRMTTRMGVHSAHGLLYGLINATKLLYRPDDSLDNGGSLVDDFVAFIAQHEGSASIDLSEFTKSQGVSQKAFTAAIKAETGTTPYQYWLSFKISEAKSQLVLTDNSIKEIAYFLGFDDEFYFSRLFKRKEGISPKGYRDRFRG